MNLSIHALAENTLRFQKHPITPLGEKVSFLSKENACFMKLLHNTYISKKKKPPNSFMSIKNIFSYYEASSYKHKQKPQSNQAILTQNSFMIPTQQKALYNMTKLPGPNFQNAIKCQRKEGRKLKLTAIFSKGLSTRDDEMKKKKKKNVLIATYLLLSNNPTKDQSLCQKIRLKTKVGRGGGDGDPTLNPTYLAFIQYKIFLPRLVLCNSSDFSGAQESKATTKQ